jgi:Flp pilus assembly protein TadG
MNMHVSQIKHRRSPAARRKGALLSIELIVVLPLLLAILLASVEFGLLLMAAQGVSAAANVGAREAALPSATEAQVIAAVDTAVQGWVWRNYSEVVIFINGVKATSPGQLAAAPTGATVSVTVSVPMDQAAPKLLNSFGINLMGKELTSTYVTRKE